MPIGTFNNSIYSTLMERNDTLLNSEVVTSVTTLAAGLGVTQVLQQAV